MKFALRLSYIGKNYCGWQKQLGEKSIANPNSPLLPSIQETVEGVLSKMVNVRTRVIASGRTDAGVNAVGQVIHFVCEDPRFTTEIFKRGLNTYLPPDIRVIEARRVADDFHAQRSATHKQYSYYFLQGPCALPHLMDTTWWIYRKLDLEAMQAALAYLKGEHDFFPFQGRKAKPVPSTVRHLYEAEVIREPMPAFPGQDLNEIGFYLVRIRLVGNGFLKQMIRGIAGTLLQVGEGKRPANDLKMILDTRDRLKVGPTAPSKGLTLERVWYKPEAYGNSD